MSTVSVVATAPVEILVLGPLEVRVGSVSQKLRSRIQRRILAVLASAYPAAASIDRIVGAVWGEDPPATVRASLQGHISDLRDLLDPAREPRTEGRAIATRGDAYVLRDDTVWVDAHQYEFHVRGARAARDSGDTRLAIAEYRVAETLWRGPAYEDVADVVAAQAAWLDTMRTDAQLDRYEMELASSNVAALIPTLESEAQAAPLDERVASLLVRALYRTGQRREALLAHHRIRDEMASVSGLELSADLAALEGEILRDDPLLRHALGMSAGHGPLADGAPPRSTLVGRDGDVTRVLGVTAQHRLVTLLGPPGVGKSALAASIVGFAPEHSCVVDLAGIDGAHQVIPTIADAVGARDHPLRGPLEVAGRLLGSRLLVLDGHDLVREECAVAIETLLAGNSGLRILTTGRRPLDLAEEQRVAISPLAPVNAVELMQRRAGEALDASDEQLLLLAEMTDGLPLAIEVLAPHLRSLGAEEVLRHLSGDESGTASGFGDLDPSRGLDRAVARSLDLLSDDAQRMFEAASVFRSPFAPSAVRKVAAALDDGGPSPSSSGVTELVEAGLLTVAHERPRRLRVLTPLASHGRGRLTDLGQLDAALQAHASHMAEIMAASVDRLGGHSPDDARTDLLTLLPDFRAALDWLADHGDVDDHLAAVGPLFLFWFLTGRLREGLRESARAVDREGGSARLRVGALTTTAFLAWWQADYATVRHRIDEARSLTDDSTTNVEIALLDASLAWAERRVEDADRFLAAADEASRGLGDVLQRVMVLAMCGQMAWFNDRLDEAGRHYRECAEAGARMGNEFLRGIALRGESLVLALADRRELAQIRVAESLALANRLGDPVSTGQARVFAGLAHLAMNSPSSPRGLDHDAEPIEDLLSGLETAVAAGDMFCVLLGVCGLAEAAARVEDWRTTTALWTWVEFVSSLSGLPIPAVDDRRRVSGLEAAAKHLSATDVERAADSGRELAPDALPAWTRERLAPPSQL